MEPPQQDDPAVASAMKTFKGLVGYLGEKAVRAIATEHNGDVAQGVRAADGAEQEGEEPLIRRRPSSKFTTRPRASRPTPGRHADESSFSSAVLAATG